MRQIAVRLAIVLSLLLLSGCGFQLRGSELAGLNQVQLDGASEAPATFRVLRDELQAVGVDTSSSADPGYRITLVDEESIRRTVATTDVIDAAEYEIRLELVIRIDDGEAVRLPETTVYAERVFEMDRNNLSGSFEQQSLLMNEMRREIAGKVIRRLEAISRPAVGTSR